MKRAISIILPIFLFVAIFGFALMCEHTVSTMHNSEHSAPISACFLDVVDCTAQGIDMAIQHINAYNSFFSTKVSSIFYLISLIGLILIINSFEYRKRFYFRPAFSYIRSEYFEYPSKIEKRKISKWISLFENSPTFR